MVNFIVYLISERAVWPLRWDYYYRCNSDHIASLPIIFVTEGAKPVYHGPGELISFLAIGHLLVLTEGNLPYHMKILIKFAPFYLYFTGQ